MLLEKIGILKSDYIKTTSKQPRYLVIAKNYYLHLLQEIKELTGKYGNIIIIEGLDVVLTDEVEEGAKGINVVGFPEDELSRMR